MILFRKLFAVIILVGILLFVGLLYWMIYLDTAKNGAAAAFTVNEGNTVASLSARLKQDGVIKFPRLFSMYLRWKGLDRKIQAGLVSVEPPVTIARVAAALTKLEGKEISLTIIPGWNARDVADYLVRKGLEKGKEHVFYLLGESAQSYENLLGVPWMYQGNEFLQQESDTKNVEGYLAPETIRFFAGTTVEDIFQRFIDEREKQFTPELRAEIARQGKTIHEILTMASILEKEVRTKSEKAKVADLFWRRLGIGMALQADSTVHYAVGGSGGDVFTSASDRAVDSSWNTYKYPGLPPGPICNPSLESIMAAIYPEKNDYWYFLTTSDGEVKYGKTLEEHNRNRARYL